MLDFFSPSEIQNLVSQLNKDTSQNDLHIQRLSTPTDYNFNDSLDLLTLSTLNPMKNSGTSVREHVDRITKIKYVEEDNKGGVKRTLDDSMEENWVVIGRGDELKRPKLSEGEEEIVQRERFTTAQVAEGRIMEQYRALGGRVYSNRININDPLRARSRPFQAFRQFVTQ